jgi:hypothetical protein
MKKLILSLVLSAVAFGFTATAGDGQCDKSKGECPKKEACDKAKKEGGGCCKEKQDQTGKKKSSDQAQK